HIQKTGGNAVSTALGQNFDCSEKHFFAHDLRELYGADCWNSYFKFAFVRNPWDRLVSWWSMINANRAAFSNGAILNKSTGSYLRKQLPSRSFFSNCDEEIVDNDGNKWIYRNQLDYLTDSLWAADCRFCRPVRSTSTAFRQHRT